jgi:hypothetical protein
MLSSFERLGIGSASGGVLGLGLLLSAAYELPLGACIAIYKARKRLPLAVGFSSGVCGCFGSRALFALCFERLCLRFVLEFPAVA